MADTHITIGDVNPRIQYTADGTQTAFPFPFPVFAVENLTVYLDDTQATTGYAVTGAGESAGGIVTFDTAPANGVRVTLVRKVIVRRTTDFQQGGAFRAKVINDELDYLTAAAQEVRETLSRVLQRPVSSPSAASLALPEPVASRALKWSDDGSRLENSSFDPDQSATQAEAASALAQNAQNAAQVASMVAIDARDKALHHATKAALSATSAAGSAAAAKPDVVERTTIAPTLDLHLTSPDGVPEALSFTRASTATRFNAKGLLEIVATDIPRIDHDPITGECKGLLIEEARTNLLTWSEDISNAAWNNTGAAVAPNAATAPDGVTTADRVTFNSVGDQLYQNRSASSGVAYSFSFYAKSAPGAGVQNIRAKYYNGVKDIDTADVPLTETEWTRVDVVFTSLVTGTINVAVKSGSGTPSDVLLWGAQLEQGSFPTSYIPTASAAATRAPDVAVIDGADFASFYNQSEGTVVAEAWLTGSRQTATANFIRFMGATSSDQMTFREGAVISGIDFIAIRSGAAVVDTNSFGLPTDGRVRIAAAISENDWAVTVNGNVPYTITSGLVPVVNRLVFAGEFVGHIKRLTYWPKRLPNATLQALTE